MTDLRHTIPKEFSLREQALVVHQTAKLRDEHIQRLRSKGKMGDEDMNLQSYNLAVLYAAANTLKALHADGKGQKPGERAAQGSPADEQSGETSPALVQTTPQETQQVTPQVEESPPAPAEIVHPEDAPMVRSTDDDGF